MNTQEYAINMFNSLNENQLLDFIKLFADDNTLALIESEMIANNPNRKHYNSLYEILEEIDDEEFDDE